MRELDSPPRVMNYSDYHGFLRDFYKFKKAQNRHFSFRRFAQLADIKSSNFLMLVMDRKRRLSPAMGKAVAKAMRLTRAEADYFVALVKLEHATQAEDIALAHRERKIAVRRMVTKDVPSDKAEYLSVWYYSVIRELPLLRDFVPDAQWISARLRGLVTAPQAERSIELLFRLGFWKKAKGKVQVCDVFVDTGPEERTFGEINVTNVHKQNLAAWLKILDDLPRDERELGLIHIPIHAAKIPELKKRIQSFQDEIIGWLQDESDATEVVQLGTYLVPVTKS